MPTKNPVELGGGTLYFAHSGEKIGVVEEINVSEPIELEEEKDRVLGFDAPGNKGITIKVRLNDIFGGRKNYNKTLRKWLEYSYTEFRFPKKRWRSRKRRMKRFLKRIHLYAKGEPVSEEEWQIYLKETYYDPG